MNKFVGKDSAGNLVFFQSMDKCPKDALGLAPDDDCLASDLIQGAGDKVYQASFSVDAGLKAKRLAQEKAAADAIAKKASDSSGRMDLLRKSKDSIDGSKVDQAIKDILKHIIDQLQE